MVKIPLIFLIFSSSSLAFNVRCNFRVNFSSTLQRRVYECVATLIESENSTHVEGYTGVHQFGLTSDDVETVNFSNCAFLTIIPHGIVHFFPNLRGLHFRACGIVQLVGDELQKYPNLEWKIHCILLNFDEFLKFRVD